MCVTAILRGRNFGGISSIEKLDVVRQPKGHFLANSKKQECRVWIEASRASGSQPINQKCDTLVPPGPGGLQINFRFVIKLALKLRHSANNLVGAGGELTGWANEPTITHRESNFRGLLQSLGSARSHQHYALRGEFFFHIFS